VDTTAQFPSSCASPNTKVSTGTYRSDAVTPKNAHIGIHGALQALDDGRRVILLAAGVQRERKIEGLRPNLARRAERARQRRGEILQQIQPRFRAGPGWRSERDEMDRFHRNP